MKKAIYVMVSEVEPCHAFRIWRFDGVHTELAEVLSATSLEFFSNLLRDNTVTLFLIGLRE